MAKEQDRINITKVNRLAQNEDPPLPITRQQIFELIRDFAGQVNVVTVPRLFIEYTGDIASAVLLNQMIYWSGKSKNNGWFFKTYSDWQKELGLSEYQVRRISKKFVEAGILQTKVKKAYGNPTVHYKIQADTLVNKLMEFLKAVP